MMLYAGRAHPSSLVCNIVVFMVSILSWNARGMGSSRKSTNVNCLMQLKSIEMVIILETKCNFTSFSLIRSFWGMSHVDWVASIAVNAAGGILITWDKQVFSLNNFVVN